MDYLTIGLIVVSILLFITVLIRLIGWHAFKLHIITLIEWLVTEAEKEYIDKKSSGREKFEMVVDSFYNMRIPFAIKGKTINISPSLFISKDKLYILIEKSVDNLEELLEKYKK